MLPKYVKEAAKNYRMLIGLTENPAYNCCAKNDYVWLVTKRQNLPGSGQYIELSKARLRWDGCEFVPFGKTYSFFTD